MALSSSICNGTLALAFSAAMAVPVTAAPVAPSPIAGKINAPVAPIDYKVANKLPAATFQIID